MIGFSTCNLQNNILFTKKEKDILIAFNKLKSFFIQKIENEHYLLFSSPKKKKHYLLSTSKSQFYYIKVIAGVQSINHY